MAAYTSEAAVRAKFDLSDTEQVGTALITASIDDAHALLERYLDAGAVETPVQDGLILGETLLAGAEVFRTLASREAFGRKPVQLGSAKIAGDTRLQALRQIAEQAERQAWRVLGPYCLAQPPQRVAEASDSQPVLGED